MTDTTDALEKLKKEMLERFGKRFDTPVYQRELIAESWDKDWHSMFDFIRQEIDRAFHLGRIAGADAMRLPYHASMTTAELAHTDTINLKDAENKGWNDAVEAMAKLREELKTKI